MALRQVFLSSTYYDMKDTYRPAAMQAIKRAGAVPIVMETFGANPERVDRLSVKEVDAADLFVLLVGFRYGTLIGENRKSITELEYEEAIHLEVPVLAYLASDRPDVSEQVRKTFPQDFIDTAAGDYEQLTRLQMFRVRLMGAHAPDYFVNPDDLAAKIERDVRRLLDGGNIEGARQLKLGYDALVRGDYSSAQFTLQASVARLREDATMLRASAARARFLLALARLNGRLPAATPLTVMRDVLAGLTTAIHLHTLVSYRLAYAIIALDASRNGIPQYERDGKHQLSLAASTSMTEEDRRNLALLERCQPMLMDEWRF